MGFMKTLNADENFIGADFPNAYFKLTNFGMGEFNGGYIVAVTLSGFASRDAAKKHEGNEEVPGSIGIGGSARPVFEPELYRWNAQFNLSDMFPDGVPSSLDEAKAQTYRFLKDFLSPECIFEDVFEDGQQDVQKL